MKKIRWGVVFITLFFLLFLGVVGYGYYLFLEQAKKIETLQQRLKALDSAQSYTQRVLDSTKAQIKDLELNLGSLEDSLKEQVDIFDERLTNFNERIATQERTTKDISSKLRDITSKVWSLEDQFQSLRSKGKVDLGNISVEKN